MSSLTQRPHDPHTYVRFRPLYPKSLYFDFWKALDQLPPAPRTIVDLGSGTGLSLQSLLLSMPSTLKNPLQRLIGVEPDLAMLDHAKKHDWATARGTTAIDWIHAPAEASGLSAGFASAVSLGSSYHWLNPQTRDKEILRVLKRPGLIHIFETQFPKAIAHPELNEWIRRGFNERWRFSDQKPRGSLTQLTSLLERTEGLRLLSRQKPVMRMLLSPHELVGLLFSQSRWVDWSKRQPADALVLEKQEIKKQISDRMGPAPEPSLEFDFNLTSILLQFRDA